MVDFDQWKLFVGGISSETSEEALRDHFSKYGAVVESVIARNRVTGSPRGFGFVRFSDSAAFTEALKESHVILERKVDVKRAVPRSEQHQNQHNSKYLSRNGGRSNNSSNSQTQIRTKKIFVGGLAASLTEDEFKAYFEKFGRITDVVVMHDNRSNRPRGFGFITFDSEHAVEDVTRQSFHELSGKFVEVKRAVPKGGYSDNNYNMGTGNYCFPDAYRNAVPIYRPITGYVGAAVGYPFGPPSPFSPGFPLGGFYGVSYEVACVGPTNPLMCPPPFSFRGSPLPYGSVSTLYPAYLFDGVRVSGTSNGIVCNGTANTEVNMTSAQTKGIGSRGGVSIEEVVD